MSFAVRYSKVAREDLFRLFSFAIDYDLQTARKARAAIRKGIATLGEFPYACRIVSSGPPQLRELLIPFGVAGYVALYEIEDDNTVTVIAIRHQREGDYR